MLVPIKDIKEFEKIGFKKRGIKMSEEKFLVRIIENLQEEIKRLKKLNKNTIKMQVNFDEQVYEIDTQISAKLKEMEYYYLADDYKNPTKVKFICYEITPSIDNKIIICAKVLNLEKNEFEYYFQKNLYKTANIASDEYLKKRS